VRPDVPNESSPSSGTHSYHGVPAFFDLYKEACEEGEKQLSQEGLQNIGSDQLELLCSTTLNRVTFDRQLVSISLLSPDSLHPQFEVSEMYEICITPIPGVPNWHECWIVRQMHGYFDEITKTFQSVVETVYHVGERQFLTCADAINHANELVLSHAQNGFRFLFVMSYTEPTPPW
jgi:hypothetical protein